MALIIALNAALSFGAILGVVAPLAWAILSEHRDVYGTVARRRRRLSIPTRRPTFA